MHDASTLRAARKKFGLLEKHKDYVERARNFHKKEDTLRVRCCGACCSCMHEVVPRVGAVRVVRRKLEGRARQGLPSNQPSVIGAHLMLSLLVTRLLPALRP